MTLNDLTTPSLLLDVDILDRNLAWMQERANRLRVALRPHIKTHKSPEIARRQARLGARGLTVSTFAEAQQFTAAGFDDLTWALPLPPIFARPAVELAGRTTLRLLVDSPEALDALGPEARRAGIRPHVWLKVDCGAHRAGVDPASSAALGMARRIIDGPFTFDGILTHAGQSYSAANRSELAAIAAHERDVMVAFAERLRADGVPVPGVSIGSTPTMRTVDRLDNITEIRPGNYAFFDLTQAELGVCGVADCAVTVLASIISHRTGSDIVITDAGALALSKDRGAVHLGRTRGMGRVFRNYAANDLFSETEAEIRSLSQEHGTLSVHAPGSWRVGERVRILEHHSCLTAAQFDRYTVVRGEEIVDTWPILRGRI